MKYEAVIFDLFGTLVDSFPYKEYQSVLKQMASILTVSFDTFRQLWAETVIERNTGIFQNVEANIDYICRDIGVSTNDTKIRIASKIRYDFIADRMRPRKDAIDVLSYLQSQGLRIGLISNCTPETPLIWKDTPFAPLFDITVFSCSVGVMKPNHLIYKIALEQLATKPGNCLYIGDGGNQELTGAANIGMHPAMISVPYENNPNELIGSREEWDSPIISSLREVLTLLE